MYYIYHIPGVKIGCTDKPKRRIQYRQGYTEWEILETHEDIYVASDREIELQKEYGYPVDIAPYWKSASQGQGFTDAQRLRGGSTQGRKNKQNGHFKIITRLGALATNAKRITCEHCGKESNPGNHKQHHGDNCKLISS